MSAPTVAVTGSSGYLGSVLSRHLSQRGYDTISLTRRQPSNDSASQWRHFDLGKAETTDLDGVDVLVHAAWVLSGKDPGDLWRQNVVGSRRLIETAVATGVQRILFVSSMSAYFGTRQSYGLMKLAVERTVLDVGGISLRPGLVYGDSPGGMAGTLKKVSGLPLWPDFRSARLYLAHEDDVASATTGILDNYPDFSGQVLGLANPERLDLGSILAGVSQRHERRPRVPVPAPLVMTTLRVLELLNVKFPFRSDSLLGLVEPAESLPGQQELAEHHLTFRPLIHA